MASIDDTVDPLEIEKQSAKMMLEAPNLIRSLLRENSNKQSKHQGVVDGALVPSSLGEIVPILKAAIEIEEENPRAAYLCRFHAFMKSHEMDPMSIERGVRHFKTYLLHKLEKEEKLTENWSNQSDAKELLTYYQRFYEKKIRNGESTQKPEELAKNVQIATVLYEVLKGGLVPQSILEKIKTYAEDVKNKREQYENYNILPLYAVGVKPAIMELPEIEAAIYALHVMDNLPMLIIRTRPDSSNEHSTAPMENLTKGKDIFDWIALVFGFQKGNVRNQREHLILLLANMNPRNGDDELSSKLHAETVKKLRDTIFKNYESWCEYVRCECNTLRFPEDYDIQQIELIYIALYLLIWGEASNIRFMPECICYIFHHMCHEVYKILDKNVTGNSEPLEGRDDEYFLREIITPIYQVLLKEVKRNKQGTQSHSNWRNYDDLNEYFWSNKCFDDLKWPLNPEADFFGHSDETHAHQYHVTKSTVPFKYLSSLLPTPKCINLGRSQTNTGFGKRKPKTNFVEVRTFFHLYRSFDRMWIFFILALQAMIIIAWSSLGPVGVFIDANVLRNVMTIFITHAFLNFLGATLDIILSWNAMKNMKYSQVIRYFLKFMVASVWVVVLSICYSSSPKNPSGLIKFGKSWDWKWENQSLYMYVVVLYILPNIVSAILFCLPPLRRTLEHSNMRIITFLIWWTQPKLYVGRGMDEDMLSLLKYTLFWIMVLISKLAFSYYVEILPLVGPTKVIMGKSIDNNQWHKFFPKNETRDVGVLIAIWAPIILVYFMDTQIWYTIYATLLGVIIGAFSHLGEIRTLEMLHSRFRSVPRAFSQKFWTGRDRRTKQVELDETYERNNISHFSQFWNEFIESMREEDLISDRERDVLHIPYSSTDVSVVQWPIFLLINKIPQAVDIAANYKTYDSLYTKIRSDAYMFSAVIECYESLKDIILKLLVDRDDKMIITRICSKVERCIQEETFAEEFKMKNLPLLIDKLREFLNILIYEEKLKEPQITKFLQDIVEIILHDFMSNGLLFMQIPLKLPHYYDTNRGQNFVAISFTRNSSVMKKVIMRVHMLLGFRGTALDVPQNLEARRRIIFFANSLFMNMSKAPRVRNMLSFSVLTPYYKENVLYSAEELSKENEDGISILFYITKMHPDESANFYERVMHEDLEEYREELIRQWASYRGPTLYRTVRGMMYYRQALILQFYVESAGDIAISERYSDEKNKKLLDDAQSMADLKFTYVVFCQAYASQKKSKTSRDRNCCDDILNLMLRYHSLRVAYIDEIEETKDRNSHKTYFSVLIKGGEKYDEEIYRIKLPGAPTEIGEEKAENQNQAIIFTRGEALQTVNMNQVNYYEETFKMRNVLEEFRKGHNQQPKPTILGIKEHIFTGSVSSPNLFITKQKSTFGTIGQPTLANLSRVRFHYGHPYIFDKIFHITRGGINKASKVINLTDDVFAGFNSTLRQGIITHHEYMQLGKEHDMGMNEISLFEAKFANGNGEQTLSRDVYRLGQRFDFFRMMSFYFTTVALYFGSMITVLIVYVFLYGHLYMVLSGVKRESLQSLSIHQSKPLEEALATQSVVQLGLVLVLPMVMEIGLEKGFWTTLVDFIIMQLQLASVFFTFQLGTKAHYFGRTILHGSFKYKPTGRGFVVFHAKFADNYRLYARSHFVKGLEILILLIVYEVYGEPHNRSHVELFITISMWILPTSWLFAPFLFNPSGFDWQKTVDDWTDWRRWIRNPGGIGILSDKSWESWWDEENEHLKYSSLRGKILEIILALRFFVYQYGIVHHMDITNHNKDTLVFRLSWTILIIILILFKIASTQSQKVGTDNQLRLRILRALHSFAILTIMTLLIVVYGFTISDLAAIIFAFISSGWAIILIAQACMECVKGTKLWDSIKELSRAYEYVIGSIVFLPIAILSWLPYVSEWQNRLLFSQAFSRGLQISLILAGRKFD